ncbi:MAG: hypothetical protein Q4F84_11200, partial [Fibrobacter sp.]|nr:hypothetical protein [Fibrobacter sp.]
MAYVLYNPSEYFPMIVLLSFEFIDIYISNEHLYQIIGIVFVIMIFLFTPALSSVAISAVSLGLTVYGSYILNKLTAYKEMCERQKEEIAHQNKKITDIKSFACALKKQTALEERNRFAGRIHDQLG